MIIMIIMIITIIIIIIITIIIIIIIIYLTQNPNLHRSCTSEYLTISHRRPEVTNCFSKIALVITQENKTISV